MKPKRYPYSGQKKKGSTFKTIDVMIDDNSFVESINLLEITDCRKFMV